MNRTNVITIEHNIPIPPLRWSSRGHSEKWRFLENLEINDSFYINGNTPDFNPISVKAYIYKLNSKTDRKYTVRTLEGLSTNPIAIRVWRTG
tara:strand:- start:421 stop:696 length:276 start_codon:yes stop_codon:yes gene_type:complete